MTIVEDLLAKIYGLMPAIGSPKLEGNIGSQRRFVSDTAGVFNTGDFDLASIRLSDQRKPCSMMVTLIDKNTEVEAANADATTEFRVQFGTSDVLHDSGWVPLGRGCSFSVQASIVRITARSAIAGGVGTFIVVGGFVSINTSNKILTPPSIIVNHDIAAGLSSPQTYLRPFVRGLMVLPNNPHVVPYEYVISMNCAAITYQYHITNGQKSGWIPVASAVNYIITNLGTADNAFRVLYDIEY